MHGFRCCCDCEKLSGYTVTFEVPIGTNHLPVSEEGATCNLVMRLLAKAALFHHGYHLDLDNYFSSLKLFQGLWQKQTTATGTVWKNRKGLPDEAKRVKLGLASCCGAKIGTFTLCNIQGWQKDPCAALCSGQSRIHYCV